MPKFLGNPARAAQDDASSASSLSPPPASPASHSGRPVPVPLDRAMEKTMSSTLSVPSTPQTLQVPVGSRRLGQSASNEPPASKESAGSFRNRTTLGGTKESISASSGVSTPGGSSRRIPRSSSRAGGMQRLVSTDSKASGASMSPSVSTGGGSRRISRKMLEEDSDDSEGLEDLDAVPQEKRDAVPLHLREDVILKNPTPVNEDDNKVDTRGSQFSFNSTRGTLRSRIRHRTLSSQSQSTIFDSAPVADVYCGRKWFYAQACIFSMWILLVVLLLIIHIVRLQVEIAESAYDLAADMSLRALEVNASANLSPAMAIARAIALQARAGLFDVEDPYLALRMIVTPTLAAAPGITRVQVLGLANERLVRILPGKIHETTTVEAERKALIYTLPMTSCYSGLDPMACFGLNTSGIVLYNAPTEGADIAWTDPTWMTTGPQGAWRHPNDWTLSAHLVAFINMTTTGGPLRPHILVDVGVDLTVTALAAKANAPINGAMAIVSTQGYTLASSTPVAEPTVNEAQVTRAYERLSDLPWADAVTPEMLESSERQELRIGEDLLVIRPVVLGMRGSGPKAASTAVMRAIVHVPGPTAVRPLLVQLCYAAVGVLVSPFAAAALLVKGYLLLLGARSAKRNFC